MICLLCGEPLTATPWGPVGQRGPCRPVDAERFGVDDDGLHSAWTATDITLALTRLAPSPSNDSTASVAPGDDWETDLVA